MREAAFEVKVLSRAHDGDGWLPLLLLLRIGLVGRLWKPSAWIRICPIQLGQARPLLS